MGWGRQQRSDCGRKAPGWDCSHVSGDWESHTRRSLGTIKDFICPESQGPSVYIQHLWTMNSEVLRCGRGKTRWGHWPQSRPCDSVYLRVPSSPMLPTRSTPCKQSRRSSWRLCLTNRPEALIQPLCPAQAFCWKYHISKKSLKNVFFNEPLTTNSL